MISLLVPTRNRSQTAIETVQAWHAHLRSHDAEIIVVDDGSADHHAVQLEAQLSKLPRVQPIRQPHAGLAAARNTAIEAAQGAYVYFVDDDIRPADDSTAQKAYERVQTTNHAVTGYIRVPPAYRNTVIHELWQHHNERRTAAYRDGQVLGIHEFRFAALMMPRAALHEERFNPAFFNSPWAEAELAYRLQQHGLRVQFHSGLSYEHFDMVTLSELLKKYEAMGAQAVTVAALHGGSHIALLTGTTWFNRVRNMVLAHIPRGDRAVKKLAEYADGPFVGDPNALKVLRRDLQVALKGAYFQGMLAELHDRKGR